MKTVYDIEVFERLNFVGVLRDDGAAFWVANSPDYARGTRLTYDGHPVYMNFQDSQRLVDCALKNGTPAFGFNNHNYDDYLIDDIGSGRATDYVKTKSDAIIKDRPRGFFDWESYDAGEQLPIGFSLKKWEAMSGLTVEESTIPFDYDGQFNRAQLNEVLHYNLLDLRATLALVDERADYFNGKELLAQEYGWDGCRRFSNGSISARHLMGSNRLDDYTPEHTPAIYGVPEKAANFLSKALKVSPWVSRGKSAKERTERKRGQETQVTTTAFDNVFTWGWGGLHSARGGLTYTKTGRERVTFWHETFTDVQQWDVSSMFPSIIIRDRLLGPATDKFETLVSERLKNKAAGNPLAATQKIVVNAVYGLLRLNGSRLFNPDAAIMVNVAGMVAVYNLAARLAQYGTIVQVNTDGVAFVPRATTPAATLDQLRAEWEKEFRLTLEVSSFSRFIQRDVNNYVAIYPNGHVKLKGGAVNRAGKQDNLKNTSPRAVQVAVVESLLHDTPVADTIKSAELTPLDFCFTLAALKGKTQTGKMIDTSTGETLPNRVNRVIASTSGHMIAKEKTTGEPAKFPDTPELMTVLNGELPSTTDGLDVDFDYYTTLAEKKLAQWH